MDKYSLAFSASNIGPKRFQLLLNKYGNSENAWNGSKKEYYELGIKDKVFDTFASFKTVFKVDKYLSKLEKERVWFVSYLDKDYPRCLKKLENPPIGVFVKGNTELLRDDFRIGVVGTRKMTSYGKEVTERLVSELVLSNVCIVSGLALGIDGTAHRTALQNNGKTIAILACGVDCCRPTENYSLYQEILENNGLIISEYPLSLSPQKGTFLARNRIIAALSDGVLVTEAAEDSGSLVTAEWGLKLGKKVFAVPGPITSRMSDGSLKLLKQGASLVTEANDILQNFQIQNSKIQIKSKLQNLNLNNEEKKIVSLLEIEEMTIDEISKRTKIPISKLFVYLSSLELKGIIKNNGGKFSLT